MTAPTEDLIERLERLGALESGWYANVGKRTGEQCCGAMREAAQALRALQQEVGRLNRLVDLWVPKTTCPPAVSSSCTEYRALVKAVNAATDADLARSALTGSAQG